VAETIAASNPAPWEMSTCACAKLRVCCASASSTTPTTRVRLRALFLPGVGGSRNALVSTGSVSLGVVVVAVVVRALPAFVSPVVA
jgi:hypothetical protein